ncbi:MAG: UDP-3-O-acyl-N-acetylglucosamine deacetylase [Nitrospirae bacterium]|nr:UDP-3-O-acyl-N-acetylglucosamine deacetylase [Magnetococcales bacterium]HAT51037.1 UDP-3-O-[3-hydroxymyristoyl] N-acetylglucosamine deacetylase [Alphaproteobacteria bacterium]
MYFQRTLKNSIRCTGIGLHGGKKVYLSLRPAPENTGIVFHRTDQKGALIPAKVENVTDTRLCSTIANADGVQVSTVEHLLAAFVGLGVDNAFVDLDGPEVPIMDGSAAPFVFLIQCAGVVEQSKPKKWIRIKRALSVTSGNKKVSFEPCDHFRVSFMIDFEHPLLSKQGVGLDITETTFIKDVSRARTFGFLKDLETLRASGLAKGGSLDNAIVIGDFRILNEGGLRYEKEFVRHKIIDAIGDLYLLGHPILGHFKGVRSGHAMNNNLLRKLLKHRDAWEFVEVKPKADAVPQLPFAVAPTAEQPAFAMIA